MDYKKIYYAIINKALRKQESGQRWKGDGDYYERHHIIPRSFGGQDTDKNLVLLTAREHYLCHWLLCKSYPVGSPERKKMIKAWFMMAAVGDNNRPTITMHDYARYKNELSAYMSENQSGVNNSQYGSHWYTSYITGEYKKLKGEVSPEWIPGKHFRGEFSYLFKNPNDRYERVANSLKTYYINNKSKLKKPHRIPKQYIKRNKCFVFYNPETLNVVKCKLHEKPDGYIPYDKQEYNMLVTRRKWDEYHRGSYRSIQEFTKYSTYNAISMAFTKWIPIYARLGNIKRHGFPSDPTLVGVYE